MKREKHKWSANLSTMKKATSNQGGYVAVCLKCGYVKEYVKGIPTYFRDDSVYDRFAPKCDERLLDII